MGLTGVTGLTWLTGLSSPLLQMITRGAVILQTIIRRCRPVAIDHQKGPASCKWSSRSTGLLQMIIQRGPKKIQAVLFHIHNWSSKSTCLLQMIIWNNRPLANDHPEGPSSYKSSSGWIGLLQMIIWMDQLLANDYLDALASCKWSYWWMGNL